MLRVALCLLIALACVAPSVVAWGSDGHQVVAQIAYNFLSSTAKTAVDNMLASGSTLASISTLPDNYDHSSTGGWSEKFHFVDIPANNSYFTLDNTSCVDDEGCVVTAIYNWSAALFKTKSTIPNHNCSSSIPSTTLPCLLSFVVHFVGDCHQPLHVSYTSDRGGNDFHVWFNGYDDNLHSLWDTYMIKYYLNGKSWSTLATTLTNELKANPTIFNAMASNTNPRQWANESFTAARNLCYNFMPGNGGISVGVLPPDFPLLHLDVPTPPANFMSSHVMANAAPSEYITLISPQYYTRNMRIVNSRLAAAGVRLSVLLNSIFSN